MATSSACRTFSCSRSMVSGQKETSWAGSIPPESCPSSRRSCRMQGLHCRPACWTFRRKFRRAEVALIVLVFVGIAAGTFAVVMLLTRPTKADRAFQVRVAGLQTPNKPEVGSGQQEFLRNTSLSEFVWLDRMLQPISAAHKLALLLAQAESPWNVSWVLISSAFLGMMSFAIAWYWISDLLPALISGVAGMGIPVQIGRASCRE